MTPKLFLQWGGIILLVLGILGFIVPNIGGKVLYFDAGENWAHTILGIVAIAAAYRLNASAQRSLVIIVAIVALFFGVWGFVVAGRPAPNFYGLTNLENPLDNLVHLVVGIWAVLALRGKTGMAMGS